MTVTKRCNVCYSRFCKWTLSHDDDDDDDKYSAMFTFRHIHIM